MTIVKAGTAVCLENRGDNCFNIPCLFNYLVGLTIIFLDLLLLHNCPQREYPTAVSDIHYKIDCQIKTQGIKERRLHFLSTESTRSLLLSFSAR